MYIMQTTPYANNDRSSSILNFSSSHAKVNVFNLDNLGAEHKLVADVQYNEQQNADIVDEKVARAP